MIKIPRLFLLFCLLAPPVIANASTVSHWVNESNQHSQILLKVMATYEPENASQFGVDGFDKAISNVTQANEQQQIEDLASAIVALKKQLAIASTSQSKVKQDLVILIDAGNQAIAGIKLKNKHLKYYQNIPSLIYNGLRNLLDPQNSPEQHQAALTRLNKYTGSTRGYTPLLTQAIARMKADLATTNKQSPIKQQVSQHLNSIDTLLSEISQLFQRYNIEGYRPALQKLKQQAVQYKMFLKSQILPHAREDFRLPTELYQFNLKQYGIDMPLDQLQSRARVEFKQLQNNMNGLARQIAQRKDFPINDYRYVLKRLKSEQITGDKILPFFREKNDVLEAIIKKNNIVSLPKRALNIRIASNAESAMVPAPFMKPPRLIHNTGEIGEFVLPLKLPTGQNGEQVSIDDFTYEAAAWPLSAHEARPGHELQFAAMVENGVSIARMLFAFNSVNVEGWALYMEEEVKPFLTLEGQFATNWSRLIRSARVLLDIGLNTGSITKDQALRILTDDIVLSTAMAQSELDRYSIRSPGQAISYFNGYCRLMDLRVETELLMQDAFDQKKYHDFLLAQGLLPPALLRNAVMTEFISQ
ncbi:DUF885 domain-containing protein [Thalassotalea aquiviva]|uniref:DUF885 domain-containing protein n=1 Tax=Thalassotalea aquiviva TaxID=3242415 RepID=UPI00352A1F75